MGLWTDIWVSVLEILSRPLKCIRSDVFWFYFRLIRSMTKWSSLFIMPVKEKNNCVSDLLKLLPKTFFRYLFSSYYIARDKYFKFPPSRSWNLWKGISLFDVRCWIQENYIYFESLFVINIQWLICLYLSMYY